MNILSVADMGNLHRLVGKDVLCRGMLLLGISFLAGNFSGTTYASATTYASFDNLSKTVAGPEFIHIRPALEVKSITNGDTVRISAVVETADPVNSISATFAQGARRVPMEPNAEGIRQLPDGGYIATYEGEWVAEGLTGGEYLVRINVTDEKHRYWQDTSCRFTGHPAPTATPLPIPTDTTGLQRIGAVVLPEDEDLHCAVIDAENGYTYFGGGNFDEGKIVKVALGNGNAAPVRIGSVDLLPGEEAVASGVIDAKRGYAYFGTGGWQRPGTIVKVALGKGDALPTRVGAVTLETSEKRLHHAMIDVENEFAYFAVEGDGGPGKLVKVALGAGTNPPSRVAAILLDPMEHDFACTMIDAAKGYAYLGTEDDAGQYQPGRIVKVALGKGNAPPSRLGALVLDRAEGVIRGSALDATNGYAYVGMTSAKLTKVALGGGDSLPSRVGSTMLGKGAEYLRNGVVDAKTGQAYFRTSSTGILKVTVGDGSSAPRDAKFCTIDSAQPGFAHFDCLLLDASKGYAYFAAERQLVKCAVGAVGDPVTRVAAMAFPHDETHLTCGIVDAPNGYAYFASHSEPSNIIKIALGDANAPPARIGSLTLESPSEKYLICALSDAKNGYAYFVTYNSPATVVKVALGHGDDLPTRVGAVTLDPGDYLVENAIIDPEKGYAYIVTAGRQATLIKVALGTGNTLPSRVAALEFDKAARFIHCAVIDAANGYGYFAVGGQELVKVALGSGGNPPVRVGAAAIAGPFVCGAVDSTRGYAYFGTSGEPPRIVKMKLGAGDKLPEYVGSATLDCSPRHRLSCVVADVKNGYAYFGTEKTLGPDQESVEAIVIKAAFGNGDELPKCAGTLSLIGYEPVITSAAIDPDNGYAYFAPWCYPGKIVKVALGGTEK